MQKESPLIPLETPEYRRRGFGTGIVNHIDRRRDTSPRTTTYVPRPTHDERRDDDPDAAMLALRRRTTGEEQRVALDDDDDDDATTGSQS